MNIEQPFELLTNAIDPLQLVADEFRREWLGFRIPGQTHFGYRWRCHVYSRNFLLLPIDVKGACKKTKDASDQVDKRK